VARVEAVLISGPAQVFGRGFAINPVVGYSLYPSSSNIATEPDNRIPSIGVELLLR
jgi:hypothetical protein